MKIDATELLDGEKLLTSKPANAVIKLTDYGLKRLPYDHLMNLTGFKGKEAIGGMLHLTTFRLVFKSHPLNRVQGKFSVFLPAVTQFRNTSSLLAKRLEVSTEFQVHEFVVWGVDSFIIEASEGQRALTREQKTTLQNAVLAKPDKFISDTHVSRVMNNVALNAVEIMKKVAEISTNPLDLSAAINVLEIVKLAFVGEETKA